MKRTLRFSAIIVFYNQRDFVRTAMESALNHAGDGLEVIAVDDGVPTGPAKCSTNTEIAFAWSSSENRGTCAARNAGTAIATGDYLAYLDGDDAFLPWAIDMYRQVAEAQTPALMMGPMHWFEGPVPEPGPTPEHVRYVKYDDYFAKERVVAISASAIVVRRESLQSVGGWSGFPVDDLDLLYRLGTARPVRANHRAVHDVASIARSPSDTTNRTDHRRR